MGFRRGRGNAVRGGRGGPGGRSRGGGRGGGRDGSRGGGGREWGKGWGEKRRREGGSGEDFRWRNKKKARTDSEDEDGSADAVVVQPGAHPSLTRLPSGDALVGGEAVDGGAGAQPAADESAAPGANAGEKKDKKTKFQKEKMAAVKEKRRRKFEEERVSADALMRSNPAAFLWQRYTAWAGPERLTALERDAEEWSEENVHFISTDAPEADAEDGEGPPDLISVVKGKVPGLYSRVLEPRDNIPGVCVLAVAASGLRAAHLGKSFYDGKPVGKLFSKHISKEDQRDWLLSNGKKKAAPTAVGTARRLHLLCDEGSLTLASTTVFVIDMTRDKKMQTVLDMSATRDELLDFIHVHLRPFVKSQQTKILLHVSNGGA